jgi:hypothetical protein
MALVNGIERINLGLFVLDRSGAATLGDCPVDSDVAVGTQAFEVRHARAAM